MQRSTPTPSPSPQPNSTLAPPGQNDWQNHAPAPSGPTSMARRRSPSCHLKRPAQVKDALPGRDACHRTASRIPDRPGSYLSHWLGGADSTGKHIESDMDRLENDWHPARLGGTMPPGCSNGRLASRRSSPTRPPLKRSSHYRRPHVHHAHGRHALRTWVAS